MTTKIPASAAAPSPAPSPASAPPPPRPHHQITSSAYTSGYLRDQSLHFLPGLNCLIGGRGSGKSTALELLRFTLAAPVPDERAAPLDALAKDNLGTGRAIARVLTQHGINYESSRAYGESPHVRGSDGEVAVGVSLDSDLFRVEFYGQNEIESIGRSPRAQLALIDKFIESDVRRIDDDLGILDRRLAQNAADVTRIARAIEEDEDRVRDMPTIVEGLAALTAANGPDVATSKKAFEAKTSRAREAAAVARATAELTEVRALAAAFAVDAKRRLSGAIDAESARGDNADLVEVIAAELRGVGGAIEDFAARVRDRITVAEDVTRDRTATLSARHAAQDDVYRALVEQQKEDRGRVEERDRLSKRFVELSAIDKRLGDLRREHEARRADGAKLLADLTRLRDELFGLRKNVTNELTASLAPDVRVSIERAGTCVAYTELLIDILKGSNVRPPELIPAIATHIPPDELCAMVEANDGAAIVALDDSKSGKPARAQRILDAIAASGRLHEIQTVAREDIPRIELRVGINKYRATAQLSVGQRCACILDILLIQSTSPLVIDQPEDDLDNQFIYDVLLKTIERIKPSRQIIFATHNPNIPVLGDAARVFVMEPDGDEHGRVAQFGTVDETREAIERLLEGGREAFLRRGERYGHERVK